MAGPVRQGQLKVPWEKRNDSPSSSRSSIPLSPITGRPSVQRETIDENTQIKIRDYFPSRMVEESPQPMSLQEEESEPELWNDRPSRPHSEVLGKAMPKSAASPEPFTAPPDVPVDHVFPGGRRRVLASHDPPSAVSSVIPVSAPAEVHQEHRKLTLPTPVHPSAPRNATDNGLPPGPRAKPHSVAAPGVPASASVNSSPSASNIELDAAAPLLAMKHPSDEIVAQVNQIKDQAKLLDGAEGGEDSWGEPFKVEWICTDRLPFFKTRHLRNAWNHDREVKVSRDGTELEPKVGLQLLEEWVQLAEAARSEAPPSRRQQSQHQQPTLPRSVSGS